MSGQKTLTPLSLKQKLLRISEVTLVFLLAVFIAIIMAFYHDELGPISTTILIIVAVALFLPKFLRRNFETDKRDNLETVKSIDYQNSIGSFFWTRPDKTGLFPYREFVTSFTKSAKKQLQGKIFYIDFKAKCLVAAVQILHIIFLPFAIVYASRIKDPLTSFFIILIVAIVFIKSYDGTRNFIIRRLAKKLIHNSN